MNRLLALCLFVLLLPYARLHAAEFDAKAIDALAEKALKDFESPGLAIAIVKDDKVLLVKGYGVRKLGEKDPITENTLFAIASCSKAFTAGSVAAMIDEGKMKWDDRISQHLIGFKLADTLADHEVTLRDSLCHRHGLSRHDMLWVNSPWSREEIIRRMAFIAPTTSFRSTFEYNNLMFLAAGQAVGKASGSSWEDVVQKKIFNPLGMKTACFSTTVAEKREHARPHRHDDARKIEAFPWDNIDNVGPAGSINASVGELSQWLRVQLNEGKLGEKQILSASTIKEMHTPQMVVRLEGRWPVTFPLDVTTQLSYGLGWFISDYRAHHCVSHGGTLNGFRAQTLLYPKDKLGIVVLSNLGGCRLPEALSKSISDTLLGLPTIDWNARYVASDKLEYINNKLASGKSKAERKKDTKPSLKLEEYAGIFEMPVYGDVLIALEKDALQLKWSSFEVTLDHFHFDTFIVPKSNGNALENDRIVFRLNGAGKVESLSFLGKDFKKK